MRYSLCRWTGDGLSYTTAFRPDAPVGEPFDLLDLRPDPTVPDGWCLVCSLERTTALPGVHQAIDLGDGTAQSLSNPIRNAIQNRLGINLDPDTDQNAVGVLVWTPLGTTMHGLALKLNKILPTYQNIYELYLGNEPIFRRAVPQGGMTVSTDNFNRADSTSLGSPWVEGTGDGEISSNVVRVVSGQEGVETTLLYDVDCGSADMYVQSNFIFNSDYGNIGVCIRGNSAHTSRFECRVNQTNLNCEVVKYVSASWSSVRSGTNGEYGTWASGTTTFRAEANGSSHTLYNNGVSKVTYTDADNNTLQRGGLWIGYIGSQNALQFDNYEQGKLVEGYPIQKRWGGIPNAAPATKGRW